MVKQDSESILTTNYLNRLNFNHIYDESKLMRKVNISYLQNDDITREIYLVEKIGRLHGFHNFVAQLTKIKIIGNDDSSYQTGKKITSCFLPVWFE